MAEGRKLRPLHRERKKTDRSLKSERSATDRSMVRRSTLPSAPPTGPPRDPTGTDLGLAGQRKSADASVPAGPPRSRRPARSKASDAQRRPPWPAKDSARISSSPASSAAPTRCSPKRGVCGADEEKLFSRERKRTDQTSATSAAGPTRVTRGGEASRSRNDERERSAAAVILRDEFMAIISHDLRTPLNVIALNAGRLAKIVPGGEGSEPDSEDVPPDRRCGRADRAHGRRVAGR